MTRPANKLVAFVESYPHVIAGQQRTMLSLLEMSPHRGIEPLLVAPKQGVYVDTVVERGIRATLIPYPERMSRYGGAIYRDGFREKARTLIDWAGYTRRCRSRLKELGPSAVFCNDMRGLLTVGLAARSLRIPVMIWDKLDKPHGILDWLQLPIATRNVIISQSVIKKYPRLQRWWYRNKISCIPDGADLAKIDSGKSIRTELEIPEDQIVIAIIGTVTFRKGHDRLLSLLPDLLRRVPNAQILVVGSWQDTEQDREFYRSLENRDHPNVRFLGALGSTEDIMHSLDILVVPSRHEGLGLVIVEAMAAGKPVVGANVGGIPEVIVDGETGLLFEGDDRDALLNCMVRLATCEAERQRMGRIGRARVEQSFNRPVLMAQICDSLQSLTKE